MTAKLLSISYNESLLKTREWILQHTGYEVTSALGFLDAQAFCRAGAFDLVIVGHSLPRKDKAELMRLARQGCAKKILALRRPDQPALEEADASIDTDRPEALIAAIGQLLSA